MPDVSTNDLGLSPITSAEPRKQWCVMRKDLDMDGGKIGPQMAHACMGALLKDAHVVAVDKGKDFIAIPLEFDLECWLGDRFTKVLLEVHSEQELVEIAEKLEAGGFTVKRIVDAGLTVFNGVPTFTCIGVGPHAPSEVAPIIGHLKTYKQKKQK